MNWDKICSGIFPKCTSISTHEQNFQKNSYTPIRLHRMSSGTSNRYMYVVRIHFTFVFNLSATRSGCTLTVFRCSVLVTCALTKLNLSNLMILSDTMLLRVRRHLVATLRLGRLLLEEGNIGCVSIQGLHP